MDTEISNQCPQDSHLLIIDDQPLRRAQLSQFLEGFAKRHDMRIEEYSPAEVMRAGQAMCGRMSILSVGGQNARGRYFDDLATLAQSDPVRRTVVLAEDTSVSFVRASLRAGAHGVIPTATHPEVAIHALEFILRGGIYVPPKVLDEMTPPLVPLHHVGAAEVGSTTQTQSTVRGAQAPSTQGPSNGKPKSAVSCDPARGVRDLTDERGLTPRQRAVLLCLVEAKSNKEIARCLNTTEATVKLHVRQIMRKLDVKNRTEAALFATKLLNDAGEHNDLAGDNSDQKYKNPSIPIQKTSTSKLASVRNPGSISRGEGQASRAPKPSPVLPQDTRRRPDRVAT
ncbi:response regulator transcription factor [Roseivivax halodurans]|uniref:response regulator transcription factor n=1 Tax=Roseivivax halodurans TaxID=93683 RepID=UPI000A009B07|nr:response regulator transcription factor [Roseivivax halodurans]